MIFGLFRSIDDDDDQVGSDYQSWRDQNLDNPSDDDFYFESGREDDSDRDDDDDRQSGWFGLW